MYAVLEFPKRECSVVPYIWIVDEDKCYWPKRVTQATFLQYINTKQEPSSSWPKFKFIKRLHVAETLQEAEHHLQKFIAETTSASEGKNEDAPQPLTVKQAQKHVEENEDFSEDSAHDISELTKVTPGAASLKATPKMSQLNFPTNSSSDDDEFSASSEPPTKRHCRNGTPKDTSRSTPRGTPNSISSRFNKNSFDSIMTRTTVTNEISETSLHPNEAEGGLHVSDGRFALSQLLLKKIETVIATQDQHSIILDQLLRHQTAQHVSQLQRPEDLPNLPITNKSEYRALEVFLSNEEKFTYMKYRLAAIGGSSVRNIVMGIMKFLLTNEVAMKFNWAGRDKRPFKKTKMMLVIKEAVRYAFRGQENYFVNDKDMEEAMKDWLKLAKSRHTYNLNKSEKN